MLLHIMRRSSRMPRHLAF